MVRLASLAVLLTFAPTAHAQLAGTYTIDGSAPTAGTNYQTFADATAALAAQGVSAAVTFEVAAGTYTEQVTVSAIPGIDKTKPVRFVGDAGGALPRVRHTPSAGSDWVFKLDSVAYVDVERLKIEIANPFQSLGTVAVASATTSDSRWIDCEFVSISTGFVAAPAYGVLVEGESVSVHGGSVTGGSHSIAYIPPVGQTVIRVSVAEATLSGARDRGLYAERVAPGGLMAATNVNVTQAASAAGFVGIEGVDIQGTANLQGSTVTIDAGTGIALSGAGSSFTINGAAVTMGDGDGISVSATTGGVTVRDATVSLSTGDAVSIDGSASIVVDDSNLTVGTGDAVSIDGGVGVIVEASVLTVGTGTGLRIENADPPAAGASRLTNLFVTVTTDGTGIDLTGTTGLDARFLSVLVSAGADAAVQADATSSGLSFLNLLLAHRGTGAHLDVSDPAGVTGADAIVFDADGRAGPLLVAWGATSYTDLIDFQAATSTNAGSRLGTAEFDDPAAGDLHLVGASDGDGVFSGIPVAGVAEDLDGDTRDATYPYIGADEASTAITPPLPPFAAGTYTVGPSQAPSATHFATVGDAYAALLERGIAGEVIFEVESGTYAFVNLSGAVSGTSATRRVWFRPEASGAVTVEYWQMTETEYVVVDGFAAAGSSFFGGSFRLSGTNAHIDLLNLDAELVWLLPGSSHVRIEDGSYDEIRVGSASDVTVRSNVLTGGTSASGGRFNGIRFSGDSQRAVIEDNTVTISDRTGGDIYAISVNPTVDATVRGNTVSVGSVGPGDASVGISLVFTGGDLTVVEDNRVTNESGSGISVTRRYGTQGIIYPGPLRAVNNTVSAATSGITAVWHGDEDVLLAHNTVLVSGSSPALTLLFRTQNFQTATPGTGTLVRSNVLTNVGSGPAVFLGHPANTIGMDFDVLFTLGPVLVDASNADYADLAALQAGTTTEADGATFIPEFEDSFAGDFHLIGGSLGDVRLRAPRLTDVLTDFDGDARPATTYRGADEVAGSPLPPLTADVVVTALLQGAMTSGTMRTDLRDADLVPLAQPFGAAPLSYAGTEATTAPVLAANAVVDWVLIELRTTFDGAPVERVAALLLADGSVLAADGSGPPEVTAMGDHFVVVWHRNHLAAMTATAVPLGAADLTAGVYGLGGTEVSPGVWALTAGDADGDGSVLAGDRQSVWLPAVGQAGYLPADMNLDGSVLADDRQSFWTPNVGRASQVPGAASVTGGETETRAAEAPRSAPAVQRVGRRGE